jgi:hypothetical protein
VPKSKRGAPHVCSSRPERSFPNPGFLFCKIQRKQVQAGIQQLGQDLQSGNLSQAQSDFAALQPNNVPGLSSSSSSSNGLASAFNQLATDLKSGNLSAAQQDCATVQQDLQSSAVSGHHHHHHHSAGSDTSSSSPNSLEQLFSQLGKDLQSGNLSNAQSAYASLQQEFALLGSAVTTSTASSSNALNVTA